MRRVAMLAMAGGLLLGTASAAGAATWAQYGFNAQHTSRNPAETTLSRANVHRLAPSWSASLGAGTTASAPIVAGGRVFLVTDANGGQVRAFSEATGAALWTKRICAAPGQTGIAAQPAYENGLVIVADSGGDIAAYRADTGATVVCFDSGGGITAAPAVVGDVAYYTDGGNVFRQPFGTGSGWEASASYIAPNSTPAVGHGMVIVTGGTVIAAFRSRDGAPLWHRDLGSLLSAATLSADGSRVYVGGGGLFALNAATGGTVWVRNTNGSNMTTPALAGGLILSNSEDVSTGLFAYNRSGHLVWHDNAAGESLATVSAANGVVYDVSDGGFLEALDSSTGAILRELFPPGEQLGWDIGDQAAVVDGRVFAVSAGGTLPGPTRLDAFALPG
jgi:outer membrane protein assembly factor BamB